MAKKEILLLLSYQIMSCLYIFVQSQLSVIRKGVLHDKVRLTDMLIHSKYRIGVCLCYCFVVASCLLICFYCYNACYPRTHQRRICSAVIGSDVKCCIAFCIGCRLWSDSINSYVLYAERGLRSWIVALNINALS